MTTIPKERCEEAALPRRAEHQRIGGPLQHRFEENSPLYIGLIKGEFRLHLSEHYGDATPISSIRIELEKNLRKKLKRKR